MTTRQACLTAVFGAALGFTLALPAAAQDANRGALSSDTVTNPGAMGRGAPSGNPSAAGGPSQRTQGVPSPDSGVPSQPSMANQGQNQLGMQNNGGTQGITVQPGAANQPGTLAQPGQPAQAPGASGPGQTQAGGNDVNIAPNAGGAAPPGGAATGATTPGQSTESAGGRADTTPPAATTQHTQPRTAAAPVPGANSFTEGQARARMADAGFNDVQSLELDNQGIWRGRAMRNGQPTGVALDFQGNVVPMQQ